MIESTASLAACVFPYSKSKTALAINAKLYTDNWSTVGASCAKKIRSRGRKGQSHTVTKKVMDHGRTLLAACAAAAGAGVLYVSSRFLNYTFRCCHRLANKDFVIIIVQ